MNRSLFFFSAVVLIAVLAVFHQRIEPPAPASRPGTISLAETLSGEPQGFARAEMPREFRFPQDHAAHPTYRAEWWYFTGNVETDAGRHFGFQLTLFRFALTPLAVARSSDWGTNQLYMGHLAVSDVDGKRFHAFERFSREALGLAGAQADPLKVWLEDWVVEGRGDDPSSPALILSAREGDVGIHLHLESEKPVVLQGDRGLSQKSGEAGNASYYYSLTRLRAEGSVRVGGEDYPVTGLAWMDREWSTSSLGKDQAGWDWFALQLNDGRELMYYRLRRKDGGVDPNSAGSLVAPNGSVHRLGPDEVDVAVLDSWASPRDGVRYPAGWRVQAPAMGLDLEVRPHLADQEMTLSVRYWEGAVGVSGTAFGRPIEGHGYVELTGYAGLAQDPGPG